MSLYFMFYYTVVSLKISHGAGGSRVKPSGCIYVKISSTFFDGVLEVVSVEGDGEDFGLLFNLDLGLGLGSGILHRVHEVLHLGQVSAEKNVY